jgi:Amt family ammonium transporter
VTVSWAVLGYTLAFGADVGGGLLGGFRFTGLAHMSEPVPGYDLHIPPLLFMVFQLMFAILTTALISGALADRVRFGAFVVFAGLWSLLVYAPLAHWAFSPDGWMVQQGILDFAGGYVVEINCGAAALAVVLVVGHRHGWPREAMPPHSLPLTLLGAGLLWFGWFGFNAGSALRADGLAVQALVNTHMAGVGGLLAWIAVERLRNGAATTLGAASGAVAGLVAITPAAGNVGIPGAFVIGIAAGLVCLWGVNGLKRIIGVDDSLDVFGVHAVGGILGALLTGIFVSPDLGGPSVVADWVTGKTEYPGYAAQLWIQAKAVGLTVVWAGVVAYVCYKIVDLTIGLRVPEDQEREGLDITSHGESAYRS